MMINDEPVCRACLFKCPEDDATFSALKNVFKELTMLQVSDNDGLPRYLCIKCAELLRQFKDFKDTCVKSDEHLRKITQNTFKQEIDDSYQIPSVLPFELVKIENESDSGEQEDIVRLEILETKPKNSKPKQRRKRKMVDEDEEADTSESECDRKDVKVEKRRNESSSGSSDETSDDEWNQPLKQPDVGENYKVDCPDPDCEKKFKSLALLNIHQREHKGEDPTTCEVCGQKLANIKSVLIHMKTHNEGAKKARRSSGKAKNKEDSFKRCHKCTQPGCGKSYRNEVTLMAHMRTHERNPEGEENEKGAGEPNSTICDICEKPLSSIRNMLRHRKTHRSVEERSFKCTVCYKIMVNEFSLKNHMRTHDSSKSHVCDVCGMAFVTNSGLNAHKQTHNVDKPFQCKLCPKTFKSSVSVYCHVKRNHEKECPVQCNICGKMLPTKKCLFRHCKITHTVYTTTENVYQCKQCDVKCKTKTILRNHERLHTGERKYACPLCPKTFAHSNILKKHSYFHSGERPVHCEVCDKGFYQKCALDIHMNVHKRQWIAQGMQGVTLMDLNRAKKNKPSQSYATSPSDFMNQTASSVSSTMVEQSPVNSYNYM